MDTTIQISSSLKKELLKRKFFNKETYEEVIWDLIEDNKELNEQTKKEIAQSRAEYKAGKTHSLEKIKKEMKK
jgi:predicted nucleic-acid-binding protein